MHKYVIMGVQGCGKGTQAKLLRDDFDLVPISVGDMFRWHIQNHTKLAARVRRAVDGGGMVPDDIVEELVRTRLEMHDWNYGFILDGFPRSLSQAEFLLERYNLDAVIHLEVPDAVVFQRILSRRLCADCGLDYNLIYHRPAVPDTCDVCHGPLRARPDDTPDAVRRRVADYHEKTEPILELFRGTGLVVAVDGTRPPAEVQQEIRRELRLPPHLAAPCIPQDA